MARRGTKGGEFIARERGLIRPRLASSSSLFAERGNPWVTDREADKDYPLRKSFTNTEREVQPHEKAAALIRDRMRRRLGLPVADFAPEPKSIEVDADLDAFTKASRAVPKQKYVDPKGQQTVVTPQRKAAAIALRVKRTLRGHGPDVIDKTQEKLPRPKKVKGNFYRFDDMIEPIPNLTSYRLRPMAGRPMRWPHKETDGHDHQYAEDYNGENICRLCGKPEGEDK